MCEWSSQDAMCMSRWDCFPDSNSKSPKVMAGRAQAGGPAMNKAKVSSR
jgi:hypothetical protein